MPGQDLCDDPYAEQLPGGGSSIVIWLIVGAAVLAVALFAWEKRSQRLILAEAGGVEEEARRELRESFAALRDNRPDAVVENDRHIGEKLDRLLKIRPGGYTIMRASRKFICAEAMLLQGGPDRVAEAERNLTSGLELLRHSGGSLWEFGLLGRGKARHMLGRNADALVDLDAIVSFNPSYGAAYYWRSRTRAALGDASGAAEDEMRARALDSWPPRRSFPRAAEMAGGE